MRERVDDTRERHVRPLARAVEREVAQDDGVEPEPLRVRMGKLLAAPLRDPVRGDRPQLELLAGRIRLGVAVHRRRRGEDDADAGRRGRLEDAPRREQVAPRVLVEDVPEAADARLPGEVEDAVDAVEPEILRREVDALDVERRRVLLLQRDVVVVGEAIDCPDVVASSRERLGEVRADEARRAGDDVPHSAGASGFSVPSPLLVRLMSEKNRVITIPSVKSPRRGSGRSPRASASASSG